MTHYKVPIDSIRAAIVEEGGGDYVGEWIDAGLVLFNSPLTGTTLAIKSEDLSVERVREKIEESNRQYGLVC